MNKRLTQLRAEVKELEDRLASEELLEAIWLELGPYTNALTNELRYKLQDHFGFDDSE